MAPGFPLIDLAGTAYECGRRYGRIVVERYPGYRRYLDMAWEWTSLSPDVRRLVESRAPYLIDLYRGLNESAGPPAQQVGRARPAANSRANAQEKDGGQCPPYGMNEPAAHGCTSFGVSGAWTASGGPLAGQNKDTVAESLRLYIILRIRIAGGPTILVLAYPGEVLGYGLWSTGMSLFRNSLYSLSDAAEGLTFVQWGLLALASGSVPEASDLAQRHGIAGSGNVLLTDAAGRTAAVEFNAGGVSVVPGRDGICVHANHPEGPLTSPLEHYPNAVEREHSRYRAARLRTLLESGCHASPRCPAEKHVPQRARDMLLADNARSMAPGGLAPAAVFAALADHGEHGRGLCRHAEEGVEEITTASLVAEPSRGLLHAVRGQPCKNTPATYTL